MRWLTDNQLDLGLAVIGLFNDLVVFGGNSG